MLLIIEYNTHDRDVNQTLYLKYSCQVYLVNIDIFSWLTTNLFCLFPLLLFLFSCLYTFRDVLLWLYIQKSILSIFLSLLLPWKIIKFSDVTYVLTNKLSTKKNENRKRASWCVSKKQVKTQHTSWNDKPPFRSVCHDYL